MNGKGSPYQEPETHLTMVIEDSWEDICSTYDVQAETPALDSLFQNVDLSTPDEAAETVVTNMLLEVIAKVGRFSPWYTRPARDFGLVSVWDKEHCRHQWVLTVDTYIRWLGPIQHLKKAIQKNRGLLQGMLLVERLMQEEEEDPCAIAHCGCDPPRFIKLKRSTLEEASIICDACLQPFQV